MFKGRGEGRQDRRRAGLDFPWDARESRGVYQHFAGPDFWGLIAEEYGSTLAHFQPTRLRPGDGPRNSGALSMYPRLGPERGPNGSVGDWPRFLEIRQKSRNIFLMGPYAIYTPPPEWADLVQIRAVHIRD